MEAKDRLGRIFQVGQLVVRGYSKSVYLSTVTKVDGTKVYLDSSPQYLRYPNRVLILPPNYDVI